MYIQDPLTVVGDVHGQYYDLLKILSIGGDPKNTKVGILCLLKEKEINYFLLILKN